MKIKTFRGVHASGKALTPDQVHDVSDSDALSLVRMGAAEFVNGGDAEVAARRVAGKKPKKEDVV